MFSKVLKIVDDEVFHHFEKTGSNPKILMLRYILSCFLFRFIFFDFFLRVLALNSTTPPMTELLKLWDFLLAFGVHLNILVIVAQILLIREELLSTDKYFRIKMND